MFKLSKFIILISISPYKLIPPLFTYILYPLPLFYINFFVLIFLVKKSLMLENGIASYPTAPLLKYSGYNPPHKIIMKGMMTLNQFKKFIGIDELEFSKGKGRQFCGTTVGTVFMSSKCDKTKQMYITVAGPDLKTRSGESLEGTLWLVNAALTKGDTV